MKTIKETKETPVVAETDVLVVGGGPAGIAAATAAARCGARVILIERYGCLGGLATGGLVLLMDHLFDTAGRRCIGGIAWEILERLDSLEGLAGKGTIRLHADSELLKIAADEICLDSGVTLRFHTWVVDTVVIDGRVVGVITESKSGRQAILSNVCVDASGDDDVAAFAGAPFETHTMRIGLNFKIGRGEGMDESPRSFGGGPRFFAYYTEEEMSSLFEPRGFEPVDSFPYPEEIFGASIQQMYFRKSG